MRIAVIGTGNVGSAVSRAAKQTGHDLVVTSEHAEDSAELGRSLGVDTTTSAVDAVNGADLVVLAIPFGAVQDVTAEIAGAAAGKVVVDVTNPIKDDFSGLVTGERSGAEVVQEQLPQAKVVKAFNTVFAANQDRAEVDGVQLDGFVAGDDGDAKTTVLGFLEQIGYRPIDAGPLSAARALEAMALLNMSLNASNGWSWQSGWKLVGPTS